MAEQRVQRRLAAILAADVVGYSRLMGADEAGTLKRLNTLRSELLHPKVEEYGGRVVKTTGDGTLIEFPSAVDAVQHAVDVQQALVHRNADLPAGQRIEIRIGINVGDIIFEGEDIFGDGVNIAARLEGLAEPGDVFISGSVHEQVRTKLDFGFDDLGPQEMKNIAEPVRVYRVRVGSPAVSAGSEPGASPPLPDVPSIAVLPFDNMSVDPEQEYFSDGITEDIITELSRFRTVFVIARNSSFGFRGQSVDVKDVGRKLGVQYVVEGSVRKVANRVRITAQLIDAETGHHLWAERYDRELEDIFAVQDEIAQTIVSVLPGRLEDVRRERAQRKPTENMTAYDLVLLGADRLRLLTRDGISEARELYQKAIELDPQYARAHANLAWTFAADVFFADTWTEGALRSGLNHIEKALGLDGDDSWYHAVKGQILFALHRDEEAEIHFRRGIALNPNDADTVALAAPIWVYLGKGQEGLDLIVQAKRLNPFPPRLYHWWHATALYATRDYENAISMIRAMGMINRRARAYLAASYAQLNAMDEARIEMETFSSDSHKHFLDRGEDPITAITEQVSEWVKRYREQSDRNHFLDGLRKAGWKG